MRTGQQRRSSSTGSTQPALASSTRAMACSTPSVVSQRNVVFEACPGRRPVRPMRCRNELTVSGASACRTRSRSPTSIPSSSVEVHTMQASPARWKLLRELALLPGHGAVVDEHVDAGPPICSATASVVDRDWQKKQALLPPPATRAASRATSARPGRWTTRSWRSLGSLGGLTTRPARSDVPCSHVRIASGLPTVADSPTRWRSWRETPPGARSRTAGGRPGRTRPARGPRR